ncbi:hypothetical protein [Methylocystis heyeri]|uniref:Uncharacterized protein n=1 Tax=Methylocystis heyeri TaxID=391905 RepID=A0A6B8KGR7_9HYPH|nr:hypothetical protein [Methylocystis heyeri]QGM45748.1 hypothetical protein H2LOC_008550 [Methylocystis heyeri]
MYSFAAELLEKNEMNAERALSEFIDRVLQLDASRGKCLISKIEMRGPALYYLRRVARKLRKQG